MDTAAEGPQLELGGDILGKVFLEDQVKACSLPDYPGLSVRAQNSDHRQSGMASYKWAAVYLHPEPPVSSSFQTKDNFSNSDVSFLFTDSV